MFGSSGSSRGVVPRGLGRAYGDAAQRAGGTVLDVTRMDHLFGVDASTGTVSAGGGASIDQLIREALPCGWFVPVTPGTRHVTVGGALAADVHGKNHHRDGSIGTWVESIELVTPNGIRHVSPNEGSDLFWATMGGMGLTGVVSRATFRLIPVETSWMLIDTVRTTCLNDTLSALADNDVRHRYSVAWLDCLSRGRSFGRGVITGGDHARLDDLGDLSAAQRETPLDPPS
ncbi:MAG: FAD-binding oxidoreductase, partial [Acidimicrobiales bacterium]